jgi:hypothetical protein
LSAKKAVAKIFARWREKYHSRSPWLKQSRKTDAIQERHIFCSRVSNVFSLARKASG